MCSVFCTAAHIFLPCIVSFPEGEKTAGMKYILVSIGLVLFPVSASAALSDYAENEYELQCIESLKLTEEKLRTGFYKYQIDRCAEELTDRLGHAEELSRLTRRIDRLQKQYGRMTRNSRRLDLSGNVHSVIRVRGGRVYEDIDITVVPVQRTRTPSTRTSAQVATTRAARAKAAREACKPAPRSFYPNCVREELRQPGRGVAKYISPSVIQQRRGAGGGRTQTPQERRQVYTRQRIERAAKARDICRNVSRSYYQNCVRNQMRLLGQ